MSLRKFGWRAMWKRPGRTILTLLSIVIGVAAVVSVTIMTATTRSAYKQMFAAVMGKTSLVIEGEGGAAFSEDLVETVAAVPGVQIAVPVVRRPSVLYAADQRIRLTLLGVDVERDHAVREYVVKEGRTLQDGKELLLDESFARRLQVKAGDEVKLLTKRSIRPQPIQVVGLLQLRGASALQNAGLILVPLRTAQSWYAGKGKIDSIQIVVGENEHPEEVRGRIAPTLPTGVSIRPPVTSTPVMQETLFSSEKGLQMAIACMLLLAAFIILNTFLMNVGERRRQLSILRAIGATGGQIMLEIVRESVLLGLIGTIVGTALGLLAVFFLNRSLAELLEVPLPAMVLSLWPFVFAVAFGMGVSLVGAVVPAWRAGRVSPLEGMDRVSREDLSGVPSLYYEVGLILVLIGAILTTLTVRGFVPVDVGIGGGIVLLIGMVFLQPFFLAPGSRGVTWGLRQFWRVTAGLALRQVLRHRPRSALTIGVLFVAGAAGTALSCSILDNVRDVEVWYKQAIVGDFFVRAMLPDMGNFESANLPDGLREVLEKVPGVRTLEGVSWKEGHVGESTVIVVARDLATDPAFDVVAGDRQQVRTQMLAGQVVVGSVVAQRMNLTVGGTLDLETQMGKVQLPICAVVNDYMAGGLSVVMSRGTAEKLLALDGYDAFVVRAPRENHASVREQLQKICDDHGVLLHSYAEVTGVIDGMVKGIDGFLWGLVVLIFIVASFGIVNTLTMSVLEQTRELGLLRIVAMTKRQVRSTIIIQSLIMSLVGFAPGIAAGVGFAYIINLAMPAALGHPIEFGFHPWLLLVTLLSALAVTSMAAWIPARRAANLDLVTALHYE